MNATVSSMSSTGVNWESAIAELLRELSATQTELLSLLAEKREYLVNADGEGLAAITEREERLVVRLEACQHKRCELLARAQAAGRPAASVKKLASSLPRAERASIESEIQQAAAQSRLLQHHSLTNWVIVQRSLIHLAQMLEIIATRGRMQPTYGMGALAAPSGAFVDQAA